MEILLTILFNDLISLLITQFFSLSQVRTSLKFNYEEELKKDEKLREENQSVED